MKKIIFVNAGYDFQTHEHLYPIELISLGTILKSNGYDVEIVDFLTLSKIGTINEEDLINLNLDVFAEYIYNLHPDVVIFLTMYNITFIQIAISKRLKILNKDVVVIFNGPHVSYCPEEMLTYHTCVDLVAIGEGESIVLDLMNSIRDKDYDKLYSIPGIGYRDSNNKVIINPEGPLIEDLDTLPIPDFSLLPILLKFDMITVEAGRGCFGKCTYCSSSKFWKKYRIKSINRILDEVQYIQDTYGHKFFKFRHDSIIQDVEQFKNLCKEIIRRNMKFKWYISVRIDKLIDEELIKLMRDSGCTSVFMGIESGSPRVQKLIKKNLNVNTFHNVLKMLIKYDIEPHLSFIYNFPFETDEDLALTLKVINDAILVGVKQFSFTNLSFIGKTEIVLQYQDQLKFYHHHALNNNIEEFLEIIKKCPQIFYEFYKIISDNNPYIREYVLSFMKLLSLAAPKTYLHLISIYNNDPFTMYKNIIHSNENILEQLVFVEDTKYFKKEFLKLKIIQDYINSSSTFSTRIKETLKYEMDIINLIMLKQTNTINHYKLDPTDDTYNDPISITLDKDNYNSIIYRKSTNYFTEDYNLYISPILVELIKRT